MDLGDSAASMRSKVAKAGTGGESIPPHQRRFGSMSRSKSGFMLVARLICRPLDKPVRNTLFYLMIKTITKVGNSQGIIFDSALLELAHLKAGDEVNIEVHDGGTITLTPIRTKPTKAAVSDAIRATMKGYARTMKKLA